MKRTLAIAADHAGYELKLSIISYLEEKGYDANICSLPARFTDLETAREIVDAFPETEYEGGKHDIRVKTIPIQQ
jgi:ribose 5-phosphate isomerase B